MEKLYRLVETETIYVEYTDLTRVTRNKLYGLYLSDGNPVILLDKRLILPENRRLHRCILSEELGHHYTAPSSSVIKIYGNCSADIFNSKIKQAQDERRAIEWATDFVMPNEELRRAIKEGCRTGYDLAERFDVTEWFVYRKFGILKAKYKMLGMA